MDLTPENNINKSEMQHVKTYSSGGMSKSVSNINIII